MTNFLLLQILTTAILQHTFATLTDQTRAELAEELLKRKDRSLAEIANELGYTESQNFIRAFKRWTGQTPEQFRARSV